MRKQLRKIVSGIWAAIIILSLTVSEKGGESNMTAYAAGTEKTVTFYVGDGYCYGSYCSHFFTVDTDRGTFDAFCLEPPKRTPSAGTYTARVIDNNALRAALYYGYGGEGLDDEDFGMHKALMKDSPLVGHAATEACYTHLVVSYIFGGEAAFYGYKTFVFNEGDEKQTMIYGSYLPEQQRLRSIRCFFIILCLPASGTSRMRIRPCTSPASRRKRWFLKRRPTRPTRTIN